MGERSDWWADAHEKLVTVLQEVRDAGMEEEEVLSAVDDVYHESDEHYVSGGPKRPKKEGG